MKRKTHDDYVKEVSIINPEIDVIGVYNGGHTQILHRCKIDGHEWLASPANILRGRGCPMCKRLSLRNNKIKTHEQYVADVERIHGNIIVVGQYVGNKVHILHKCMIDGYMWEALPGNILKGSGCPLCALKEQSISRTKSHDDYIAEVHEINPNIDVIEQYIGAERKILHKCKVDGYEWYALPSNILSGHGCPRCNESHGEKIIEEYLRKHQIKFEQQYTFLDCRNKKPLPFDFYISSMNVCIEYDGIQHFEPVKYFGGVDALKQRQHNDNIKTNYCLSHNIDLLRIKYDQDINNELDIFWNNTKLIEEAV